MTTILLIIIYIAFISLGLPDSIMGSAWPIIHQELMVPISFAGPATMVVTCGTVISSLMSAKLLRRFGTGKITVVSVILTAVALLGISFCPGFIWICILGIPLGLGAGAIDAALNNFVALHYEAKHMNWLHCFWGVGATAGPFIMSLFLADAGGWRSGYRTIGMIQTALVLCLLVSLPLWKKFETSVAEGQDENKKEYKIIDILKMKGAKPAFISFFCYCGMELTTGLWGSTFLVQAKGLNAKQAALWIAIYYLGITAGRLLAGFLAIKWNNQKMMRAGEFMCLLGALLLFLPFSVYFQLFGFLLIGIGFAPIYPAMLHETPNRFGKEVSQGIMGMQMACAYVGSTLVPPLFGFLAKATSFHILPLFLILFMILMLVCTEKINRQKSLQE